MQARFSTARSASADTAALISVTAAAVAAVWLSGGRASPLLFLLCLPALVCVALPRIPAACGVGAALAAAYVAMPGGPMASAAIPATLLFAFTVGAAMLGARVHAAANGQPVVSVEHVQHLEAMAYTDAMTQLLNYRSFRSQIADECHRAARYGHPLSLVIMDLDGFKTVNDRFGHPAGDRMLAWVASIIRASVRETDLAVRYGGEEFAVICPETGLDAAMHVAERIRGAVCRDQFEVGPAERCGMTASAGVATLPDHAADDHQLIDAADAALYSAKAAGKNRVVGAVGAGKWEPARLHRTG